MVHGEKSVFKLGNGKGQYSIPKDPLAVFMLRAGLQDMQWLGCVFLCFPIQFSSVSPFTASDSAFQLTRHLYTHPEVLVI